MKVKIKTPMGVKIKEVAEMTKKQFAAIKEERDTPEFIMVDGILKYNEYTCLSSVRYGGTCLCINHPVKRWVDMTYQVG